MCELTWGSYVLVESSLVAVVVAGLTVANNGDLGLFSYTKLEEMSVKAVVVIYDGLLSWVVVD